MLRPHISHDSQDDPVGGRRGNQGPETLVHDHEATFVIPTYAACPLAPSAAAPAPGAQKLYNKPASTDCVRLTSQPGCEPPPSSGTAAVQTPKDTRGDRLCPGHGLAGHRAPALPSRSRCRRSAHAAARDGGMPLPQRGAQTPQIKVSQGHASSDGLGMGGGGPCLAPSGSRGPRAFLGWWLRLSSLSNLCLCGQSVAWPLL